MSMSNRQWVATPMPRNAARPFAAQADVAAASPRPIKRRAPRPVRRNVLLRLPIATQLSLGFLVAALIAAFGTGIVGVQRADSLNRQSLFYQNLLRDNTFLTNGNNLLQLMNTERSLTIADATVSTETLASDETALQKLATTYDTIITGYVQHDLVAQHGDQKALLAEGDHSAQILQQQTFAISALRTWQAYQAVQARVLTDIQGHALADATTLDRVAGEPLNADASSALRALIQFDGRLAGSVQDAASAEQNGQNITTIIAAIVAFLGIAVVGWTISSGIVRRLGQLRAVTQAVEDGEIDARVRVVGRDELAEVSASVNAMLDTIVGLLEETRRQRDALTRAADRLFTDMRVAGAGDLRASAAVSNDPIGMLGNAFNLTVGRFRRFLLRTRTALDQLDGIARREAQRTQTFFAYTQQRPYAAPIPELPNAASRESARIAGNNSDFVAQMGHVRDIFASVMQQGSGAQTRAILEAAEEAYLAAKRLNQFVTALPEARSSTTVAHLAQLQSQEMVALEAALNRIGTAAYAAQQTVSTQMNDVNQSLAQLAASGRAGAGMSRITGGAAMPTGDMANAVGSYAQEIGDLAHEVHLIIEELRSGMVPFQLEQGEIDGSMPMLEFSPSA